MEFFAPHDLSFYMCIFYENCTRYICVNGIYESKDTSKKCNFTKISAISNISSVDFYKGSIYFAKRRIILCYAFSGLKFIGKYGNTVKK